ncbi:uncharacterized protein LOC141971173 [Athene noctua]|uniref:uncharacterized protein LOC141971173 n=1 Tax=Athene noctua TaxID=126797 RepID=UPI003EB8A6E6
MMFHIPGSVGVPKKHQHPERGVHSPFIVARPHDFSKSLPVSTGACCDVCRPMVLHACMPRWSRWSCWRGSTCFLTAYRLTPPTRPARRLLESYDSLRDKHLGEYFKNTRIRRHLQRSGLISRSGRIIPEKEYRLNTLLEERLKYVQEYLAGTVFNKAPDRERHHQPGAEKKPAENGRKEKAQKVKEPVSIAKNALRNQPALGTSRTHQPVQEIIVGSSLPLAEKPLVAPDNRLPGDHMQRQGICSTHSISHHFPSVLQRGLSILPQLKRSARHLKSVNSLPNSGVVFRSGVHSGPCITMAFLGRNLHLLGKDADKRSEITVYQQHCGGENLCVYKGNLLEGETFQFISRRHRGFPFSLTFILNGLTVDRLSCCCEYRHRRPSTVGGRQGYFRFVSVEGASPCYRCIIAMGLDNKPVPPKKKMEEDREENPVGSGADGVCIGDGVCIEPEYDEDIEAEERQIDGQMNGTSESPSGDKKPDLDIAKESETASEKALEVSDSEKDEDDGYSDSDFQDDEQASLSEAEADEEEKTNPEDLTAREDAGTLDEDTTSVQRQVPEVPGELKQAVAVASLLEEDKERDASSRGDNGEDLRPSESSVLEAADSDEEGPDSDEGSVLEDCSPVRVKTATAAGHGDHMNSEPDDSCPDVEEEVISSGEYDASEAPDGTFLAEGTRTLDVQEAEEKVSQEGQRVEETQALEKADFIEEEGEFCTKEAGEEVEWVGDLLPQEEILAVLQAEGQLVVEESAPEESAMAEGHPKRQVTGKGRELGTELARGEQDVLVEGMESEADLEEQETGEEELSGGGDNLGREEGRMQPEGLGGAEDLSESDDEDTEIEESEAFTVNGVYSSQYLRVPDFVRIGQVPREERALAGHLPQVLTLTAPTVKALVQCQAKVVTVVLLAGVDLLPHCLPSHAAYPACAQV